MVECEGYKPKNDEIRPTRTSFADASSSNSVHTDFSSDADLSCAAPSIVQSPEQACTLGSRISTLNPPHLLSPQHVCTVVRDPACFNLIRLKQYETFACQSSMQQHCSHNQSSMLSFQEILLDKATPTAENFSEHDSQPLSCRQ